MSKGIVTAIRRDAASLVLPALASFGLFRGLYGDLPASPEEWLRPVVSTLLFFFLSSVACRLFAGSVRRHVAREQAQLEGEANRVLLITFVAYKEGVKAVFGASLLLAWMAGVLFILERFAAHTFLVPLGLGLAYSALLFALVFAFAALLDAFRYPFRG